MRFSLRALFVLMTSFCFGVACIGALGKAWCAWCIELREEMQEVSRLERIGVHVATDVMLPPFVFDYKGVQLDGTPLTDSDVARLIKKFPDMRSVVLNRTKITNGALPEFANLRELRFLHVDGTAISDAGVPDLCKLRGLEYLSIEDTRISDQGRKQLARALPKCTIYP